jgi:hypothetical protein
MLLMNMNIAVAYICLRNLLDRPCLRAFYCGVEEETEAYYRVRQTPRLGYPDGCDVKLTICDRS